MKKFICSLSVIFCIAFSGIFVAGCGVMFKLSDSNGKKVEIGTKAGSDAEPTTQKSVPEYGLNEDIYVSTSSGEYRVKFTNIYESYEFNDVVGTPADRIIVIEYEYENISMPSDLCVSEANFKVYDSSSKILDFYPTFSTIALYPEEIGTGRNSSAAISYALNNEVNHVELDYYVEIFGGDTEFRVIFDW